MYLTVKKLAFNFPHHPSYLPVMPHGAIGETTSKLVRQHMVQNTQFEITKSCDDALKQQVLAAFNNDYVEGVAN